MRFFHFFFSFCVMHVLFMYVLAISNEKVKGNAIVIGLKSVRVYLKITHHLFLLQFVKLWIIFN